MKTKTKEKQFDTVKTFRKIKDKISKNLSSMNIEEIRAYLKEQSLKFQEK